MSFSFGETAPGFTLPAAGGGEHSLSAGAPAVVVFTCNHCPYALAWQERIDAVARDYAPRGVRFFAINPNDAERYPRDSFEAMQERVAAGGWPDEMPYLRDETQEVARAYGAKTTPDVFVLDPDLALRYRGAPDSSYEDPSLNAAWLRGALDALLDGAAPDPAQTEPVGCSVKWKD
jgi:thiol-disulfide isomerase/thioredoxin